jgi:Protein of unknown function (DUF5672)
MTAGSSFAVVVPVYRARLTDDERLSLRHLEHYLPDTEKFLVMPHTLDFSRNGYREARFAPGFFAGIAGCNRLRLSRDFYARFEEYEFILIHELDAIILGSDVERFLEPGVDYLGAPWIEYDANSAPFLTNVGNGGFSLRRVSAFRRLLDSPAPRTTAREYYRRRYSGAPLKRRLVVLYRAGLKGLGIRTSIRGAVARRFGKEDWVDFAAEARDYTPGGEDWFISGEARNYSPNFTIGNIERALEFAFEREPRFCYEKAGGRMPLGAHAWSRYDREFWEPYLLS